jgi:ribosomal protein S18 acetylase RimI-like enzyme
MAFEIVTYHASLIEDLLAFYNRETADAPFVVPLRPEIFEEQIVSKPYFSSDGCFVAVENDVVIGFALTCPGVNRRNGDSRYDVGTVDGLFFLPARLDVGDALLNRCMMYFETVGDMNTIYGFASAGGYPFWRGLYCGAEPVCLTHHTHVWTTFMARGFVHHQQSINYLGVPERRSYRDDLMYEVTDLVLDNASMLQSWKGHHPKRMSAILDGNSVGWIGYADLPFLSDYRQKSVVGIYSMGVGQNFRRQGIASSLINHLFHMAFEQGVSEILVGTTVENVAARRTYEKGGMRPIAFRTGTMFRYS